MPLLVALGGFGWALHWFQGFIQDDTYISMRYAWNLAQGRGLVFNVGERVEGFTNLLWTLFAAVAFRFDWPALTLLRIIGGAAGLWLIFLVWYEAGGRAIGDPKEGGMALSGAASALVLASSTSLAVWSVAGLEESFFVLLAFAGVAFYARQRFPAAAVLFLLAALTRPEGVMVAGIGVLIWGALWGLRIRAPGKGEAQAAVIFLGGYGAFMLFRLWYFGDVVPNTFWVKGVTNAEAIEHGWKNCREFLAFNHFQVILGFATLGLVGGCLRSWDGKPEHVLNSRIEAGYAAALLIAWVLYLVRIGGEFLPFYRLYLPMWPFAALWAGRSLLVLQHLASASQENPRLPGFWRYGLAPLLVPVALGFALYGFSTGLQKSHSHPEYRSVTASLEGCHGEVGRFLEAEARALPPGQKMTVIAQDMGCTPYYAPSIRFVDTIGLVDRTIAKLLYSYNYTPYIRYLLYRSAEKIAKIAEMEAKARDYLERQQADYIIINTDCPLKEIEKNRQAIAEKNMGYLLPLANANVFYYGIANQPWFLEKYDLAHLYVYSSVHSILLFRRRE